MADAQRVIDDLRTAFEAAGTAQVRMSFGVAVCPDDARSTVGILAAADEQLLAAKAVRRDGVTVPPADTAGLS